MPDAGDGSGRAGQVPCRYHRRDPQFARVAALQYASLPAYLVTPPAVVGGLCQVLTCWCVCRTLLRSRHTRSVWRPDSDWAVLQAVAAVQCPLAPGEPWHARARRGGARSSSSSSAAAAATGRTPAAWRPSQASPRRAALCTTTTWCARMAPLHLPMSGSVAWSIRCIMNASEALSALIIRLESNHDLCLDGCLDDCSSTE